MACFMNTEMWTNFPLRNFPSATVDDGGGSCLAEKVHLSFHL